MECPCAPGTRPLLPLSRNGTGKTQTVATFVLVHGGNMSGATWNRLAGRVDFSPGDMLGPRCRDGTVSFLASRGHAVLAPALADERTTGLSGHVAQVTGLIRERCPGAVILVGHSYRGMVITGTAAAVPERVSHMVSVDAALPDPGQSLFDLFLSTGCDPSTVRGLEPADAYMERTRFDPQRSAGIPRTSISCTKNDFSAIRGI